MQPLNPDDITTGIFSADDICYLTAVGDMFDFGPVEEGNEMDKERVEFLKQGMLWMMTLDMPDPDNDTGFVTKSIPIAMPLEAMMYMISRTMLKVNQNQDPGGGLILPS